MDFSSRELEFLARELPILRAAVIINVDTSANNYNLQTSDGQLLKGKPAMSQGGGGFLRGTGCADMLQEGALVLYYPCEDFGYIIGPIPQAGINPVGSPPVTYTNVRSKKERSKVGPDVVYRGANPTDLLAGDFARYTPEGGVLALLRGAIAKLGASPLSNIQFLKQDDLCRLTSRNVEMFTDFMELRSENDEGESNLTVHAAPNFFETMGADQPTEEIGEHSPDEEKLRYTTKPYDRTGKWRIHSFAGWLGDNLHLFISRRGDTNKRVDKEPSDGLTEIIISHDGAVRVRSCRELMLEKVSFIPVPKKIRESFHNDKGDTEKTGYVKTPHEVYDWSENDEEGRRMQVPEYHNHMVDHEEKRHFRDHEKDWNVISEKGSESKAFAPPPVAKDIYEGQQEAPFEKTYSLIHQRSDGSVYIEDTDGSCIDMNKGNVSISAKQDLRFQAGRDVLFTAGREMTVRATKDIDIVSHKQSVRVKANEDLRLVGEKTATLESVKESATVTSRKGDVQLRSERASIIVKADLGDLKIVTTEGQIQVRAKQNVGILSDTARVDIHGSAGIQITSAAKILIATGVETPSPGMKGEKRECGTKTDISKSTDEGNLVTVTELPENSYLVLQGPQAKLFSRAQLDLVSSSTRIIAARSHLTVRDSGYTLSTEGRGVLRRERDLNIHARDSDIRDAPLLGDPQGGTINDKNGDFIWTKGSSHNTLSVERDPVPETLESVKADINKEKLAEARFRYKDTKNDDYKVYEYPWQHDGGKITMNEGLVDWSTQIPSGEQDIPDIGMSRPVTGENQACDEDPDIEQMAPYSSYKKFTDGEYVFEGSVTPGTFEETEQVKIPLGAGGGTTTTVVDEAPSGGGANEGRINKIPLDAMGESFKGDLSRSKYEDIVNEVST